MSGAQNHYSETSLATTDVLSSSTTINVLSSSTTINGSEKREKSIAGMSTPGGCRRSNTDHLLAHLEKVVPGFKNMRQSNQSVLRSSKSNLSQIPYDKKSSGAPKAFTDNNNRPGRIIAAECEKVGANGFTDLTLADQVKVMRMVVQKPRYVMYPDSKYMERWDLLMVFLLMFVVTVTPLEVAFIKLELNYIFWVNRVVDVAFLKDLILQFVLAIPRREPDSFSDSWVTDLKTIRRKYLHSWFLVDLMSVLPYDILGLLYSGSEMKNLKIMRILKALRLIKVSRCLRASRLFQRWFVRLELQYAQLTLYKWVTVLLLMSHLMACVWVLAGQFSQEVYDASWQQALNNGKDHFVIDVGGQRSVYNFALYWSIMTITSIGYGDIAPQTDYECCVCTFTMLLGGALWAFFVGTIVNVITNMFQEQHEHEQRMDMLLMMGADRRLPKELRKRLRSYFDQNRRMMRSQSYEHLSNAMSPTLRGEVAVHIVRKYIRRVPWLINTETGFLLKLATSFGMNLYSPGELAIPDGYQSVGCARPLSIMERGLASRLGRGTLTAGSVWHDDMILWRASLMDPTLGVALAFCSVYCLSRETLFQVIEEGIYPEAKRLVRTAAAKLMLVRVLKKAAASYVARSADKHLPGPQEVMLLRHTSISKSDSNLNLPIKKDSAISEKSGGVTDLVLIEPEIHSPTGLHLNTQLRAGPCFDHSAHEANRSVHTAKSSSMRSDKLSDIVQQYVNWEAVGGSPSSTRHVSDLAERMRRLELRFEEEAYQTRDALDQILHALGKHRSEDPLLHGTPLLHPNGVTVPDAQDWQKQRKVKFAEEDIQMTEASWA